MNRRYIVLGTVMALGMLAVLALYLPGIRPEPMGVRTVEGEAKIGGAFSLTDQHGNTITANDLKGKYLLVFFGFTHCPDICPITLQTVTGALEIAGPLGENVIPVFISVDPERDTPELMGQYVANFHPRFVALTGPAAEVKKAADAYRVFYRKAVLEGANDYTMEHSGYIYFMGPDGGYITHFRPNETAQDMAARIRQETSLTR